MFFYIKWNNHGSLAKDKMYTLQVGMMVLRNYLKITQDTYCMRCKVNKTQTHIRKNLIIQRPTFFMHWKNIVNLIIQIPIQDTYCNYVHTYTSIHDTYCNCIHSIRDTYS